MGQEVLMGYVHRRSAVIKTLLSNHLNKERSPSTPTASQREVHSVPAVSLLQVEFNVVFKIATPKNIHLSGVGKQTLSYQRPRPSLRCSQFPRENKSTSLFLSLFILISFPHILSLCHSPSHQRHEHRKRHEKRGAEATGMSCHVMLTHKNPNIQTTTRERTRIPNTRNFQRGNTASRDEG